MATTDRLQIIIEAQDRASAQMKAVDNSIASMNRNATTMISTMGQVAMRLALTSGALIGVERALRSVVKAAIEYDQALVKAGERGIGIAATVDQARTSYERLSAAITANAAAQLSAMSSGRMGVLGTAFEEFSKRSATPEMRAQETHAELVKQNEERAKAARVTETLFGIVNETLAAEQRMTFQTTQQLRNLELQAAVREHMRSLAEGDPVFQAIFGQAKFMGEQLTLAAPAQSLEQIDAQMARLKETHDIMAQIREEYQAFIPVQEAAMQKFADQQLINNRLLMMGAEAAGEIGAQLTYAAFTGGVKFGEILKQIVAQLAAALIKAVIIAAIWAALSGGTVSFTTAFRAALGINAAASAAGAASSVGSSGLDASFNSTAGPRLNLAGAAPLGIIQINSLGTSEAYLRDLNEQLIRVNRRYGVRSSTVVG